VPLLRASLPFRNDIRPKKFTEILLRELQKVEALSHRRKSSVNMEIELKKVEALSHRRKSSVNMEIKEKWELLGHRHSDFIFKV
jgi:hypothetical protein